MAEAAMKTAEAATKTADAAMKKADASWELVIITKNQIEENRNKSFFRRLFNT